MSTMYVPSPEIGTNDDGLTVINVRTNDNVCSTTPYTIEIPLKGRPYAPMTLTLSDEECDLFTEALAEARAKRLMAQEQAYEMLHAKFAGPFTNDPIEDDTDLESI